MVRDPAQVWGSPLLEDDIKVFANFGTLFNNGTQFYGHANYATRTTTAASTPQPAHALRRVQHDGGGSILVGDRLWASTGVAGAGGCPALPVVSAGDNGTAPDPAALAAIEANRTASPSTTPSPAASRRSSEAT